MHVINSIVVATDFSAAANRAVLRAALIAKQYGAELHLLHVIGPFALYPGQAISMTDSDAIYAATHDQHKTTARRLHEHYGIQIKVAQRIGRAHTQIADYATTVGADLVVIGARGEGSMLRLLLGSTAWQLLRVRQGPVLIVRGEPVEPYGRVLAAVDFFPYTRAVIKWANLLAKEEHIRLLHVLEPMNERSLRAKDLRSAAIQQQREEMLTIAQNLMGNLRSDLKGEVVSSIEVGYPQARILECAAAWRTELIVLGRQGRGGLEDFLLGSVSKDVAQAADCDVLVTGAG